MQETLIEIINVKDSRKNELVECNKDLTRLQMSMKPLFIYANNIWVKKWVEKNYLDILKEILISQSFIKLIILPE